MSELEQAEVQALQEAMQPERSRPRTVEPRDFSHPRSLSSVRLNRIEQLIGASLPGLANTIASTLRSYHKLHLASVTEVSATTLFHGYEAPFLVHCLQVGSDPAWLIWDGAAATAAVDQIVTGEILEEAVEARRLSRSECRVIEEVLDRVVSSISGSLGLTSVHGSCAQDLDELTTLRDAGPDADARRLLLQFSFDGPGGSSDLRLLIPGVGEEALELRTDLESLPDHLSFVDVEVSACLGTVDVPLSQLLELEIGDVIPLGVEVGTPLNLFVEERPCATATFGQLAGRMAVNLDRIDIPIEDLHPPTV